MPTCAPLQKLPKFSFPLRKKPVFSEPLGNIQKIKGTDAATPSEMTIKGPSENLFHQGGVDIKWNGPVLSAIVAGIPGLTLAAVQRSQMSCGD